MSQMMTHEHVVRRLQIQLTAMLEDPSFYHSNLLDVLFSGFEELVPIPSLIGRVTWAPSTPTPTGLKVFSPVNEGQR